MATHAPRKSLSGTSWLGFVNSDSGFISASL
jgi:hypothetical protein